MRAAERPPFGRRRTRRPARSSRSRTRRVSSSVEPSSTITSSTGSSCRSTESRVFSIVAPSSKHGTITVTRTRQGCLGKRPEPHYIVKTGQERLGGRLTEIGVAAPGRDDIVARYGPWTAHNIRLGDGTYTISAEPTGDEPKLRRIVQLVSDLY